MKIVMPIAQFTLGHGGAEMQAHRLARALITRGHQVEIVTTRPLGQPAFDEIEGVPVRRLFAFGNRRGLWRLAPYSYSALLLRELLRERPDVVHTRQAFHPAWTALFARRRFGGAPVVVKVATAGEYGDVRQMREGRPTLPVGSARMLRQILGGADALVAISSAIEDELRGQGAANGRIVRIPNGVELPPADRRRVARRSPPRVANSERGLAGGLRRPRRSAEGRRPVGARLEDGGALQLRAWRLSARVCRRCPRSPPRRTPSSPAACAT